MPSKSEAQDIVARIHAEQRTMDKQRNDNFSTILGTLAQLNDTAQKSKKQAAHDKDQLDTFLRTIFLLPYQDRPTGQQMAEIMGLDRRSLYVIKTRLLKKGSNRKSIADDEDDEDEL